MNILDSYSNEFPSSENAVSIFKDEWASRIPGVEGSGAVPLFEDARLTEIIRLCGGLEGKDCLELGPLEGGHTFIMWKSGAKSIISIEGNQRAFLKCLITKELLGYKASFIHGDFIKYVESAQQRFDFTNMSGVLYHMAEPHKLISNVARISNQVACWTHYFDEQKLRDNPKLNFKFDFEPKTELINGMSLKTHKQRYLSSLKEKSFCGGKEEFSYWMPKDDILALFKSHGLNPTVLTDEPDHPHGPAMNFYATR